MNRTPAVHNLRNVLCFAANFYVIIAPQFFCKTTMIDINDSENSKQRRSLFAIAAAIAFVYSPGTLAAKCVFSSGSKFTANFGSAPINLTVPRDAPIGTIVYQESITAPAKGFTCGTNTPFIFALNPALGSVTTGNVFPLGKTGLSLKINYQYFGYLFANGTLPGTSYRDPARSYTIEIIKSTEQPMKNIVPAGHLGTHMFGDLDLVSINLTNPIILNSASCQTPDVTVQMGEDYQLQDFSKVGNAPRTIKFNIELNECQTGIQKVTYSLRATSQVIDQKNGVMALNTTSTAKGIGLKLMNDAGQPIDLGTTYSLNGFNANGTNFKIPLSAAYYRLADKLEAGTANASATFTVNYL
ncbi:type 1 fimbrial protein [Pseudomonas sp. N3-W]|uniref:fimbrial protein n=1 Tax=Pseudomonas sp. N3-W TaxID=2975049 RepID=UPI00217D221B|nr:fimbrial protein [Pseudomonas sp. N3-W]UWF51515.1 type 1 fimbrial protein [Pseudomonas sp. N3-W]